MPASRTASQPIRPKAASELFAFRTQRPVLPCGHIILDGILLCDLLWSASRTNRTREPSVANVLKRAWASNTVRWLLVLPAALAGDLLSQSLGTAFIAIFEVFQNHTLAVRPFLDTVIWQAWGPVWFVVLGSMVAPRYRFRTAVVLAFLKSCVALWNTRGLAQYVSRGGSWTDAAPLTHAPNWWEQVVYLAVLPLLVLTVLAIRRHEKEGDMASSLRSVIGGVFTVMGWITTAVFGIWGLIVCLSIVNRAAGFWGVVVGFVLLPVTFAAAPWYAVVASGDRFPVLLCYGGGIASAVFFGVGRGISGD